MRFAVAPGKPLAHLCWNVLNLSHSFVKRNDAEILDLILERAAKIRHELFILAMEGGSPECIEVLLKHGAKVDAVSDPGSYTPFAFAVMYGNIETAKYFAKFMATP